MGFDPSMLVLFCFAITCIIYGSVKSHTFLSINKSRTDVVESNSSIKLRTVIALVVAGCVFLLLMFFIFNIMYYLLLILVIFISGVSMFVVGGPLIDFVFAKAGWAEATLKVPVIRGGIPYSLITLVLIVISIIITWIMTGHWLIVNCMAWCIGVTQLSIIRLPNLKLSVILLGLFLLYDVFWVFISPYFFGESVMIAVATKMPMSALPLTFAMPHILEKDAYSLMGLGDVVLPGLFICFTYNFDEALKYIALYGAPADLSDQAQAESVRVGKIGYFPISIVGYTSGFFLTIVVFFIMNSGQPALLYLVPGVLVPVCAAAHLQGHLKLMWNGPPPNMVPNTPTANDEERALVSMTDDDESTLQEHTSSTITAPQIKPADVGGSAVLNSNTNSTSKQGYTANTGYSFNNPTTSTSTTTSTTTTTDDDDIVEEVK